MRLPYLTGTDNEQYPPCTLTVCAHLLSSFPPPLKEPASSLLRRTRRKGKKKDKRARRPEPSLVRSRPRPTPPVICARFQAPGPFSLSSLVSVHLFIWLSGQLGNLQSSGNFNSACTHLVGTITTATSPTLTCLGHIGRVSRLLALCGPTFAISTSSAA